MTTSFGPNDGGARDDTVGAALPSELHLSLVLRHPQAIARLAAIDDTRERHEEAVAALEIGLEAIVRARGQIDAATVREEVDRLLVTLSTTLTSHARELPERLGRIFASYLDPERGALDVRLARLVSDDGDLQRLLRAAVDGEGSRLARTLQSHVGPESPLGRLLDPTSTSGLAKAVDELVAQRLSAHERLLLREFSLDHPDGALRRFIAEIEARHGKLEDSVAKNLDAICRELSLDQADSALNRLVGKVAAAQQSITRELTLDDPSSALSKMMNASQETRRAIAQQLTLDDGASPMRRLRDELFEILAKQEEKQRRFQEDLSAKIGNLMGKRTAEKKGTQRGHTFEGKVLEELTARVQGTGDVLEDTSRRPGMAGRCRKGDAVIELGPDSVAAGARIVVEAKEDATYDLQKARTYLGEAKANRDARVGVFVFSAATAPESVGLFTRLGDDVFVVWDAGDPSSDVVLDAALSVARALSVREAQREGSDAEQLETLTRAIAQIEDAIIKLADLHKSATTIIHTGEKIRDGVATERHRLADQVEAMKDAMARLRTEG